MKERSNEARLKHMTAPAPDPAARLAAKQAALAEFARVHAANEAAGQEAHQETNHSARLSRQETDRSDAMKRSRPSFKWLVPRSMFGAVASACVVALATAALWPIFSHRIPFEDGELVIAPVPTRSVGETRPSRDPAMSPPPDAGAQPGRDAIATARTKAGSASVPARHDTGEVDDNRVRAQIQAAIEMKQEPVIVDEIHSADIVQLPNPRVAESLERVNAIEVSKTSVAPGEERSAVVVTGSRNSSAAMRQPAHKSAAPAMHRAQGYTVGGNAASPPPPQVTALRTTGAQGLIVVAPEMQAPGFKAEGDDRFQHFELNPIKFPANENDRWSTISVDVDTASYSFVRRMLNDARLPQKDAVRVEEMINYFDYAWPKATNRALPFQPTIVVSDSPWTKGKKLIHIGIKGYEVPRDKAPDVNIVLLLDVSGSMNSPDKLPLAIQSMELLLSSLKPTDTVGIVVYAGAAGKVLDPTPVSDKQKIVGALRELTPGGSTAGAEGIELAYQLAQKHFRKGGVNRILLATDGDFNVGIDDTDELKGFVERKRRSGIMLSVLGFGQGNYRDELAQALAQNGNGVAAYIDTLSEAQKVLVQESSGSLFTIAKDVKFQVEFNPATVAEYRLIGYETRALKREDFNNDAVDAGDVGSGHTVTAIYEITPVGSPAVSVDPPRYATPGAAAKDVTRNEYAWLKIRYKLPDEDASRPLSYPIPVEPGRPSALVQREVQFSTAVAGFAQLLRGGQYTGSLTYDDVLAQAQASKGDDPYGYRTEFVQLVRKAATARGM
jgi:Ca-activated chloride channel family protein